jgi:hypothetical protein
MDNLFVALVHYPVVNRRQETIASALTNLDLHDIARACMTFGVRAFYVITPFPDQRDLARQIVRHWTEGAGGQLNPDRRQALEKIRIADTLEDVIGQIATERHEPVICVGTSAREGGQAPVTARQLRHRLTVTNDSHLLIFGTAWGLANELLSRCDLQLAPIQGSDTYNHLSVRSAVSIYLDRLTND